jgi:DNA repair protein RadA/Sms
MGKCPNCGGWSTFREVKESAGPKRAWIDKGSPSQATPLSTVETRDAERIGTGIHEFDRVLGGGVPLSCLILVGGDPGVGKSTLLLQVAGRLESEDRKVLYVTAEEALAQVRERAVRLNVSLEGLHVLGESDLRTVLETAENFEPDFMFVDSIQTVYHPEIPSAPGTVSQVRECGMELLRFSKRTATTVFLVGHVTKDGTLAGPKTLEHMVDVVLYLEGERQMGLRLLRGVKNRYGSTDEIGVFEMQEMGLAEVKSPSQLFISERREDRIGVCTVCLLEGQRPLLVEVQALVAPTPFALPQRNATGFDLKRLSMLLAVLEKRTGLSLRTRDVFVNVTGGMRVLESGGDLGIAVAIVSSARKKPVSGDAVFVGEVGLGGELRSVRGVGARLREAGRLGYRSGYVAKGSAGLDSAGLRATEASDIEEVLDQILPG